MRHFRFATCAILIDTHQSMGNFCLSIEFLFARAESTWIKSKVSMRGDRLIVAK